MPLFVYNPSIPDALTTFFGQKKGKTANFDAFTLGQASLRGSHTLRSPVAPRGQRPAGQSTYISDFLRVFDGCAPLFEVLKHLKKQRTAQFCLQNGQNG